MNFRANVDCSGVVMRDLEVGMQLGAYTSAYIHKVQITKIIMILIRLTL